MGLPLLRWLKPDASETEGLLLCLAGGVAYRFNMPGRPRHGASWLGIVVLGRTIGGPFR